MSESITIDISPKYQYEPLYTRPAKRNDLWGGRGRGGSHEATLYALYRFTRPDYCRIAFVRKVLNDVRHSLWRDFKDRIAESNINQEYIRLAEHSMEASYRPTGNTVNCFGVKAEGGRTAKLKSLAGYNLVIIEEYDELTEDESDKLEDSLRTVKGIEPPMVIRIYNPPGRLHHVWNDYNLIEAEVPGYWRAHPKEGSNLLSIFGTFKENIANLDPLTVEKWIGYKERKPEYYYTMFEGLISEGQRGRIFRGWEPITQEQFKAIDRRSIFGLDFGWSQSPMALSEIKHDKNRRYGRQLIYEPMTLLQLAITMCRLGITSKDLIIADSADAASINKLRSGWRANELTVEETQLYPQLLKGFYILGANKAPGSINKGLSEMQECDWYITEDSLDWWNEYRNYKWALDKDKNPTDVPEEGNDHLMDGARYVELGKGRQF